MPFFRHDNVNLFYTTHGPSAGIPVLLIHGYACDSHDFAPQIPFLASLGLYVIAFDHRGHGHSTSPAPFNASSYSMRTLAADALALLAHLGISEVVIVAHSMGTIVASIIAAEHPTMVKAVAYLHPIYCGTPPAAAAMSDAMQREPDEAPRLAAEFFEAVMYTTRTPEWFKTWTLRRVMGTDQGALAGCVHGIVQLFGSVIGQSEESKLFMKQRKGPKLVVATSSLAMAEGWERELGVDREKGDQLFMLEEGTFSHFVEKDRFNLILGSWLKEIGLAE